MLIKLRPFFSKNTRKEKRDRHQIEYLNHELLWSESCKYLRVILDYNLTFKNYLIATRNKFCSAKCNLYNLLARNSPLSIKNKMLHYSSSLRPIHTYASMVWSTAAKTNLLLLSKSHNSVIREIYNIPFYITNKQLYSEISYPRLGAYIKKLNSNFHMALQNNNNPALNELENYDHIIFANRNRPTAGPSINLLL